MIQLAVLTFLGYQLIDLTVLAGIKLWTEYQTRKAWKWLSDIKE